MNRLIIRIIISLRVQSVKMRRERTSKEENDFISKHLRRCDAPKCIQRIKMGHTYFRHSLPPRMHLTRKTIIIFNRFFFRFLDNQFGWSASTRVYQHDSVVCKEKCTSRCFRCVKREHEYWECIKWQRQWLTRILKSNAQLANEGDLLSRIAQNAHTQRTKHAWRLARSDADAFFGFGRERDRNDGSDCTLTR